MIQHHQVKPYHRKPQNLKLVDNVKFLERPTYDTPLERCRFGDHRF